MWCLSSFTALYVTILIEFDESAILKFYFLNFKLNQSHYHNVLSDIHSLIAYFYDFKIKVVGIYYYVI